MSGTDAILGGIVGLASGSSSYDGDILGCINYGEIVNGGEGKVSMGGIVGSNNGTIKYCINVGDIKANGGSAYDITNYNNGSMNCCINIGKVIDSSHDDEYAYASARMDGFNLEPDAPELTDGSLLVKDKLGTKFWVQGEKFPVWSGEIPED